MNLDLKVSSSFYPLFEARERYLLLCGGRGSGKSEFAGRKVVLRASTEGRHRILVLRKVRKTLGDSVVRVIRTILAENDIPHTWNKSDRTLAWAGAAGVSEVLFDGLDDPEKIKSIKAITSIWIEEATEFSRDDFLKVDLCLREQGPGYKQIMMTFNPQEVEAPWLKSMFFGAVPYPDSRIHRSTIDDNPIAEVRAGYTAVLDGLRDQDEALWKIARLGEWAARTGQVYSWDVQPLPIGIGFDDVFLGGDFGYSVDPAALVQIYRKADEFWLEELIYEKGLTNQDLGGKMIELGVKARPSYWDAAEPKSIVELRRMGINAMPADKGQDSVRAGIDFIKSKKVHVVQGSCNLVREQGTYCWRKDKRGEPMSEPVAFDNHLMDAARYGIFTRCAKGRARVWSVSWGS